MTRWPGRAQIDPDAPQALGICDRCGFQYNLRALRFQDAWAGERLITTNLLVCDICYDVPNEQLRTIRLPPDPDPVYNARPENFAVDEKNFLTLKQLPNGQPSIMPAFSGMSATLSAAIGLSPSLSVISAMLAATVAGFQVSAAASCASAVTAALMRAISMSAAASDTSAMAATLTQTAPNVSLALTDSFTINNTGTKTDTATTLGAAQADRLIFVTVSGINATTSDGIDSMTIGGVSATMAVEVIRTNLDGDFVFSSVWWALVPTGTTGNTVLTFTGDQIFGGCGVYRVVGANTTTPINSSNTANAASGSISASVTPPNAGATIASACLGLSTADANISWTNITEDTDQSVSVGVFVNVGSASRSDVTSPGSISVTVDATVDSTADRTLAVVTIKVP